MADEIDNFDPEGDAILVIGEDTTEKTSKFRVSTKALSLASPVFKSLFSRNFAEGIEVQKGTCPEISLPEDSPEAMEAIFRIVHFLEMDEVDVNDARYLANIAIHANKYDCTRALQIWMSKAFDTFNPGSSEPEPVAFGHLILCAYIFRHEQAFVEFTCHAQIRLTVGDIKKWETDPLIQPLWLPDEIIETIEHRVRLLSLHLTDSLQAVEKRLVVKRGEYLIKPKEIYFWSSWRAHQGCRAEDKEPDYCTIESRMALFCQRLKETDLPSITPAELEKSPGRDIWLEVFRLSLQLRHECEAGSKCPLISEVDALQSKCWELVWRNKKGLLLHKFLPPA